MPKDLAVLLVDDGVVPADVVERALARQRDAGGALDTALLEEGATGEDTLLRYLARAAELPSAPMTAWRGDDARARRVFPSRVAERHGLAPFALDGRELSLVATYPVDVALLDEISFMLSLHLTAHVGLEWRVRELIHRLYGSPLSPRLAALVTASAGAAGAYRAAPAAAADVPTVPYDASGQEAHSTPPPASPGFARDESEPVEPLAAALAEALENVESFAFEEVASNEQEPAERQRQGGERDEQRPVGGAPPADPSAPPPDHPPPRLDRSAPPRWTLEDARAALAAARHRDDVVLAALCYARDFFEFAAMFAVTRDAVAGHDALGVEEARDRARAVAIWSTDPGIFKTVIETRSTYLGPVAPGAAGTDAVLQGLGRKPRTVLVYPVLLRDRPVCVLYADNGEAPVSPRRLGDLLLFLSTVGASFERIIRHRKKGLPRRAGAGATGAEEPQAAAAAPGPPSAQPRELPSEPRVAGSLSALEPRTFDPTPAEPQAPAAPAAHPPPPAAAPPAAARAPPESAAPRPMATPPDPATLVALAERALEGDPEAAAAACAALGARRRDPAVRGALEKLRRALLSGISGRATRAARAIGALRDVETIPLLIQALETSEPESAKAVADALAVITLQRLGPDARRWLGWWKNNRGRGRAEWLFSGLTSPDRETRVAASIELSLAAEPPVSYSADMPAVEREKAARAWAGWWSRSGHVL